MAQMSNLASFEFQVVPGRTHHVHAAAAGTKKRKRRGGTTMVGTINAPNNHEAINRGTKPTINSSWLAS